MKNDPQPPTNFIRCPSTGTLEEAIRFEEGMKIVCITEGGFRIANNLPLPSNVPVKGKVYTINTFKANSNNQLSLIMEEDLGVHYDARCFRPINRPTDISVFQQMLEPETVC